MYEEKVTFLQVLNLLPCSCPSHFSMPASTIDFIPSKVLMLLWGAGRWWRMLLWAFNSCIVGAPGQQMSPPSIWRVMVALQLAHSTQRLVRTSFCLSKFYFTSMWVNATLHSMSQSLVIFFPLYSGFKEMGRGGVSMVATNAIILSPHIPLCTE